MGKTLIWLLLAFAVLPFLGGLVIHVATYLDLPLTERWPVLWLVYFLGFILFGLVIVDAQARTGAKGKTPMFTAFEPGPRSLAETVAGILLIYALALLAIGFLQPREGNASRTNGSPAITERGQVSRQLNEREYAHIKATEFRGASALFLCFVGSAVLELISLVLVEERKHAGRAQTKLRLLHLKLIPCIFPIVPEDPH